MQELRRRKCVNYSCTSRFSQENVELLHEMKHFTPSSLMSSSVISAQDIEHICRFYSQDATRPTVARERNDFVPVYQSTSQLIDTIATFARSLVLGHVARKPTE